MAIQQEEPAKGKHSLKLIMEREEKGREFGVQKRRD